MRIFEDFWGQYDLQTVSEVTSDLRFEISDLNYLHIHVHIAYMFLAHFVASEASKAFKTALEVNSDLRFGIYVPHFICLFGQPCFGPFLNLIRRKNTTYLY